MFCCFENKTFTIFLGLFGLCFFFIGLGQLITSVYYVLYKPLPEQCRRYIIGFTIVPKPAEVNKMSDRVYMQMKKERQRRKDWLLEAINSIEMDSDEEDEEERNKNKQKEKCSVCWHCRTSG